MGELTRQALEEMIKGDLEAKLRGRPDPISYADLNAMTASSAARRSRLVRDPLTFLVEHRQDVSVDFSGSLQEHVENVLLKGFQPTKDDLFLGQFTNGFNEKFDAFCSLVLGHLHTLDDRYGDLADELTGKFIAVVSADSLKRQALGSVIEQIRMALTDYNMADEKGEITKAHQKFDKALSLGLMDYVAYTPYSADPRHQVSADSHIAAS